MMARRIQSARRRRNDGKGYPLRRWLGIGWLESATLLGPVAVVALALLAFGWLTLRDVAPVVTWLDIGSPGDDPHISGAFPPERNPSETYRWTYPGSVVTVPVPADGRYRLDLAIAAIGGEMRVLRVTCPGGETQLTVAEGQTVASIDCDAAGDIPVAISVPETRVPGDGRALGVALRDVRVTALDDGLTTAWRLRASLMAAAALVGLWFGVASLVGRRYSGIVLAVAAVGALGVSLVRPDWIGPLTAGPSGLVALAAGYAGWLLAGSRRVAPFALGVAALACCAAFRQPDLVRIVPALWTPNDLAAWRLLPALAALTIMAAALLGGRRAPWLAAAAMATAVGAMLAPVLARPLMLRWSLELDGPDWTDIASPIGAVLLVTTAVCIVLASWVLLESALHPRWALVVIVVLALAVLVPWRNAVMDLNGDEPHYYVTAHSIADDADLELLDDYLDREYRARTISPTGNIAVDRDTSPDRYAAIAPASGGAIYLYPDEVAVVNEPMIVDDAWGNREALPALRPGQELAIPVSGPCALEAVWLALAGDGTADATVRLLDESGAERWQQTIAISGEPVSLQPPLGPATCDADFAGTLSITTDRQLVAQAVDTASGLRIIPARPAATDWLLGPLPRDQYATQEATARLALYNPGPQAIEAVVTVLTPHRALVRTSRVTISPSETVAIDLDLHDGAAVAISASGPLAASAIGWLPGGSYVLPEMQAAGEWVVPVKPVTDRDAGVWVALANRSESVQTVAVEDGGAISDVTLCGYCAAMVHVASSDDARDLRFTASGGVVAMAAVAYEERTGGLHFDLGLPVLAALPIWLAGPDGAPVVSALATVLVALGLAVLLGRLGVDGRLAAIGAGAAVLLAPLSPYAVRLYTEPLATCLVVWSLVAWDLARERVAYAVVALALAGALPLVHGRFLPLAAALAVLAIVAGLRHARGSRRQLLVLAMLAVVIVAIVAVSPLAVALRERASANYFSTQWVPHNLLGILVDRGSGLLPFAPWCLLAFAVRRPLQPLQRAAIVLFAVQLSIVALRAGGWQTFGAPARYILPVVPLLALLAIPGAIRLWRTLAGRLVVVGCLAWSALTTVLLHWLPLSGYVVDGRYFISEAVRELPLLALFEVAPAVAPVASSNVLGLVLLLVLWTIVMGLLRRSFLRIWP